MDKHEDYQEKNQEDSYAEESSLNRGSLLQSPAMKQKKFGVLGFILMGAAAIILLIFFNGKEKPKE